MNKKLVIAVMVLVLTLVLFAATAAAHTPPGIAISQQNSGQRHPLAPEPEVVEEPTVSTMGASAGPAGVWE